jgi:predicted dehydrogenase/acetyltransferase-like isoleucine patch superfamily enzyme
MITIGQVGLGYWGPNVLRNLVNLAECWVKKCCDIDAQQLEKIKQRYPFTELTQDYNELMSDREIEVIVITIPASTHYQLAKEALGAGKHVFVEKPITLDIGEAEELIDLGERRRQVLMVGHLLIYHPAVTKLKEYVDSGELGEIHYIYSSRVNLGKIRHDENAMWSFAPHDLSVALYLLGEDPAAVSAHGMAYLRPDVEDVVFIMVRFPQDKAAHLHVSWLDPHKVRRITVVGSKKMAVFDDMESAEKLRIYDKGVDNLHYSSYGEFLTLRFGDIYIPKISYEGAPATGVSTFLGLHPKSPAPPEQWPRGFTGSQDPRCRPMLVTIRWPVSKDMSGYIDPSAKMGVNCQLGRNVVILKDVQVGDNVVIGHNVVIHLGTAIGEGTIIGDGAVIGRQPRPSKTSTVKVTEPSLPLEIEAGCSIGVGVVLYAGSKIGANTMIADQAFVRERCEIGDFVVIGRGVTVENQTTIGDYTKIQTGAYITACMTIEDHVFIAPCVVTTNDNFMGRTEERFKYREGSTIRHGARVGANSILLPGIVVGQEAYVAAGSVVTEDVPDCRLVMGVPARVVRDVPEDEFVENQ